MRNIFIFKLSLTVGLFFGVLAGIGLAEEPSKISREEAAALKKVEKVFEEALRKKDFSDLKPEAPNIKPPLFWTQCWRNREMITFEEMVTRLLDLSKDAKILVNPRTVDMLSEMVETYGWKGENSFLYFDFSFSFDRLYGVHRCSDRSSDFTFEEKDRFPEGTYPEPTGTPGKLKKAIQTGDYRPMRSHVPAGKIYEWVGCGPGDALPGEYSFDSLNKALQKKMGNRKVQIVGEPQVSKLQEDGSFGASIQTKGWEGPNTELTFFFELIRPKKTWDLDWICDTYD